MNRIQNDLITSLETFKDLFDHAHDLIHIVEPDGAIIYVNKAWERILEFPQSEVQGKSIYSYVTPEDASRFKDYRESIIQGASNETEIVLGLKAKSGRIVHVEGFISVRMQEKLPVYTRGIFRDVSTRMLNEARLLAINKELQEREFNLDQLLRYAPDAIIVIDEESMITYWNPKAEQIFGWTEEEVRGKKLGTTIIPPQYREAHEQGMQRYLSTGKAQVLNKTIEISALDKRGREFYISLTISTTRQMGRTAFIAFLRDIDQQKRNEIELDKKRMELEVSNQELEQFAHVASHDMKEPVRKIGVFASLLKQEIGIGLTDRGRNYIERIESSVSRLLNMVDGILAYSSLDSELHVLELVDLNTTVKNVVSDLELLVDQKKAILNCQDLPTIRGVPFLLHQLFYNLLSNSLKFSKPGIPPRIQIDVEEIRDTDPVSKASQGNWFKITFSDNGIGFSDDDLPQLFKKFSRLHSKSQYEGTGLGLALCMNIVKRHGGYMEAKGEKGVGSAFIIFFPASQPYV